MSFRVGLGLSSQNGNLVMYYAQLQWSLYIFFLRMILYNARLIIIPVQGHHQYATLNKHAQCSDNMHHYHITTIHSKSMLSLKATDKKKKV